MPEHEASGGERRERDRAGGVGEEVLLPQPRARDEGAVGGEAVGERRRARGARREDAADGGVVRHRGERARGGVHVAERVADGVDASARVAVRRACRRVVGGDELLEGNAVGAKREDEIVAAEHLDRGGRVREDVQGAAGDGALALGGARAREEGLRGEAEGLETNGEGDEGQRQRAARGSGSAAREASKRRSVEQTPPRSPPETRARVTRGETRGVRIGRVARGTSVRVVRDRFGARERRARRSVGVRDARDAHLASLSSASKRLGGATTAKLTAGATRASAAPEPRAAHVWVVSGMHMISEGDGWLPRWVLSVESCDGTSRRDVRFFPTR